MYFLDNECLFPCWLRQSHSLQHSFHSGFVWIQLFSQIMCLQFVGLFVDLFFFVQLELYIDLCGSLDIHAVLLLDTTVALVEVCKKKKPPKKRSSILSDCCEAVRSCIPISYISEYTLYVLVLFREWYCQLPYNFTLTGFSKLKLPKRALPECWYNTAGGGKLQNILTITVNSCSWMEWSFVCLKLIRYFILHFRWDSIFYTEASVANGMKPTLVWFFFFLIISFSGNFIYYKFLQPVVLHPNSGKVSCWEILVESHYTNSQSLPRV